MLTTELSNIISCVQCYDLMQRYNTSTFRSHDNTCATTGFWEDKCTTSNMPISDVISEGCCSGPVTWNEAKMFCASKNMRMCTQEEMDSGVTSGTGCGYDLLPCWTNTQCENGFITVPGHPQYHTLPTRQKIMWPMMTPCSPTSRKHAVRCCADIICPTNSPSSNPSLSPSEGPSATPWPSWSPSSNPTNSPSTNPSIPTAPPSVSTYPSASPTTSPSDFWTEHWAEYYMTEYYASKTPSNSPTRSPTPVPSIEPEAVVIITSITMSCLVLIVYARKYRQIEQ